MMLFPKKCHKQDKIRLIIINQTAINYNCPPPLSSLLRNFCRELTSSCNRSENSEFSNSAIAYTAVTSSGTSLSNSTSGHTSSTNLEAASAPDTVEGVVVATAVTVGGTLGGVTGTVTEGEVVDAVAGEKADTAEAWPKLSSGSVGVAVVGDLGTGTADSAGDGGVRPAVEANFAN